MNPCAAYALSYFLVQPLFSSLLNIWGLLPDLLLCDQVRCKNLVTRITQGDPTHSYFIVTSAMFQPLAFFRQKGGTQLPIFRWMITLAARSVAGVDMAGQVVNSRFPVKTGSLK